MGTHYQGHPDARRALDAYIKLTRAAETLNQRINAHLTDYHLTVSQFGVLEAIYHLGPLQPSQLAHKILRSSGDLTFVIDALVGRGLVTRQRRLDDRRCVDVDLTPAGRALLDDLFPRHVAIVLREMAGLTSAEQEDLARLCRQIGLYQSPPVGERQLPPSQ